MRGFGFRFDMIQPTFKITGIKMHTAELKRAVVKASMEPMMKAGALVEGDAKRSMRQGGGASRTPSAPGTPPNAQLGDLKKSITHARDGNTVIVGPTERYGQIHEQAGMAGDWAEFGGRNYPKRAFMMPALGRMARKFAKLWASLRLR